VEAESWPLVRDPDELHDALLTLILLPAREEWREFFSALRQAGRACAVCHGARRLWVAAERVEVAGRLFPEARLDPELAPPPGARKAPETPEGCVAEVLRGWLESTGPQTASGLAAQLGLATPLVEAGLAQLEAEGQILRGRFRPGATETEWCNRRLLARMHRLTIGRLRREIEPVATADFVRFLFRWQHAAAGARLHGADGLFQVIRQLQGFECPAAAWESEILPLRIERYSGELLDELCLSGEVVWGRLSPHPSGSGDGARVRPTRIAPIALFLREDFDWLAPAAPRPPKLSYAAQEALEVLAQRGASFFSDLVRATRRLPSEIEEALWELLAAGLVTADTFENLRALVDPKRRRGQGRGRLARPRHAGGRWALLRNGQPVTPAVEPLARQLLLRWGVVFRELAVREPLAPPWRDLLVEFRRLEARGEIRGGRFVAGFLGEQFALPEALELLRAIRRSGADIPLPEISPADPLNLTGVVLPGPRVSALQAGRLRLL
jgi:ATP-dependent Lhr-like helicase